MTNLFRQLKDLLPQPALQVATVSAANADGTLTVTHPDGNVERVRGEGFVVGNQVFVRSGVAESIAPTLTPLTIEI